MAEGFDTWLRKRPEWLAIEESHWAMSILRKQGAYQNALAIADVMAQFKIETMIEFGPGTGWIPWLLRENFGRRFKYLGVDNNEACLTVARDRCPEDSWIEGDIYQYPAVIGYDLAACFSMMKHITLERWREVWFKIQQAAPITVASLNICKDVKPIDDSGEYIHNWVPESWVFEGTRRLHYMKKTWEDDEKMDILVVFVEPSLYAE